MNAVTAPAERDFDLLSGGGEMGALIRSLDWSKTPIGAMQSWSPVLRMMVSFLLINRFPLLLWWGPDYIQIYNDAYRPVLGSKHPQYLGRPVRECWSEIIDVIGPLIDKPFLGGPSTWMEDIELEVNRHGYFEESHFTIAYSPVPDDTAPHGIGGVLATVHEITEKVIGQRRVAILSELGSRFGEAKTGVHACQVAAETLAAHPKDIAYALIYLSEDDGTLRRVCQVRTPGAPAPERVTLDGQDACGPWPFGLAVRDECAEVTEVGEGKAVVLPIKSHLAHRPAGVVVIGTNPKIALDAQYVAFLELLTAQIGSAVANASAYEYERQRAEALAEVDRAKTIFFSNVSHEFRTPLTLILGPLEEALAGVELPARTREQLDLVRGNAQRLLKLVKSLLEFSRIEAGRIQASYQPTDLAVFTRDLAGMFRSTMERAGLRYRVECQDLEVPVYVDREMWEKIVLNLLSNAFKFTLEGEVAVRLRRAGALAILEVTDTGVGIAPAEMPRLFERFHRVSGAGGRSQEGTGIGLALAHELVRLHGGTIEACSEPGRGTTLRVAVPLGSEHLPAAAVGTVREPLSDASSAQTFVHEASRWLPGAGDEVTPRPADGTTARRDRRFAATFGARIVLADDNADMRAYLCGLLAPMYSVEAVGDGAEALVRAAQQRPELILADVMMPNLDGFGLVQRLRATPALRDVPVILLSARAGEESRIEGLDAGADDYLVKPFTARELLARVGALLERRHASEAVSLRAAQFETLFQATPVGVYLVDADFRIRDVNPVARELFGSVPDLVGRDFGEVLRLVREPEYAVEVERLFRHTLETGEPFISSERALKRPDRGGATEYYEWQIHRIPLPDGRHGVVCHFRDISAHVRARLSLEVADRQKNEFLAMLAHELRNPMAPIKNVGELLARDLHGEQRHAITNILRRQVAVLSRLVDDLLDVSRITQGRIELKKRALQLAEVIAQAVETVQPLLNEHRHQLSVVSHGPLRVSGDPTRLVQCVVNLLSNSAKYTQPGGEVRIESQQEDAEAVITVTDNGAGITPELLPYVFDLFVQSARTLDRAQGGLGVGLSLVQRLVELHGGRVAASSPGSGRGATFQIRLPLLRGDEPEVAETAVVRSAPRRILIVDDNADSADSLGMLLELEGHEVELSYDARDALRRVQALKPDVVLLDIGLPHVNGYEVARAMRSSEGLQGLRLVALTGYGQAEDRQLARAAGFDEHLVKPVDPAALKRALARS
jgi:PAS domain S-box-containing protein